MPTKQWVAYQDGYLEHTVELGEVEILRQYQLELEELAKSTEKKSRK